MRFFAEWRGDQMALTLSEQLRAAHVRRWHIVQVAREQTLAEHSYCVAILAGALASRMKWGEFDHDTVKLRLLNWALNHDLIEVRTGDMPTPFKKALEQVAGPGVVEKAETLIDNDEGGKMRLIRGTQIEMVVKLADLLEAIKFLGENGLGDHASSVLEGIRNDFSAAVDNYEKQWPNLEVRRAAREVCNELGVWGGSI